LLVPLAIFYIFYYALLVYYITASVPESINVDRWRASLDYRAPQTGPFFVFLLILLLLPQVIGGFAYFTLYFRVTEATQKYRVLLVSWSIIIWFLSPFIAIAGGLSEQDWWQLTSRLIGLAAALTILMAYLPPRWLKERYGIISLRDEIQKR
jgi:Kef-type K+ transport system membrane component KefB